MSEKNLENHMVMNNFEDEEKLIYCDRCGAKYEDQGDENCGECGQYLISDEEYRLSWEEDAYRNR